MTRPQHSFFPLLGGMGREGGEGEGGRRQRREVRRGEGRRGSEREGRKDGRKKRGKEGEKNGRRDAYFDRSCGYDFAFSEGRRSGHSVGILEARVGVRRQGRLALPREVCRSAALRGSRRRGTCVDNGNVERGF